MTSSSNPRDRDAFARFRAGFPALRAQTYLSVCDKTILHDRVRAGVETFLDHLAMASASRSDHEAKITGARAKFARLMKIEQSSVAITRNVSDGINALAWAMPLAEGDNVVVSLDAEHPNNAYPWLRLRRRGLQIRSIPPRPDGALDIEAMIAAIDARTRIVTCASVTFAPGHRTDLARLGAACRRRGVFLLVDGAQSAGILAHDLGAEPVDGFAASTAKGLLGLTGFGFLYVSPDWIDRLEPAYLSRPAVAVPADDHSTMGALDYRLHPDGRRFEVGGYNLAGAYAADASLELLLDLGAEAIERRALSLARDLNERAAARGLFPAVPSSGPAQSHIVTFGAIEPGRHGFSRDPMIAPVSAALTEARVVHTVRRGQLRFALHAFNDESDVARAVDCIAQAVAAARLR